MPAKSKNGSADALNTKRRMQKPASERSTVSAYLSAISRIPQLTHDQSTELFKRLEKEPDSQSVKDKLVTSNLRLVVSIAKQYKNTGVPLEDLCQEGNIGLMKAVDRFKWRKGYRFSTYASWWIRQAIGMANQKQGKRTIRLPSHAITVQRKLIQASEEFKKEFGEEPTQEELAGLVPASKKVIKATMASGRNTISLSSPAYGNADSTATIADTVADEGPNADPFETLSRSELLNITRTVMEELSDKELAILRLRFGLVEDPTDSETFPVTEDELEGITKGVGLS